MDFLGGADLAPLSHPPHILRGGTNFKADANLKAGTIDKAGTTLKVHTDFKAGTNFKTTSFNLKVCAEFIQPRRISFRVVP